MTIRWSHGTRVEILIAALDQQSYPLVNAFLPAAAMRGWVKGTIVRFSRNSLDRLNTAIRLDVDYPEVAYREFSAAEAEALELIRPIGILDELAGIA